MDGKGKEPTSPSRQTHGLYSRIEKYESITDRMEIEIATYLRQVGEGRLSNDSKAQILQMLRQVDELESIGDSCFHLARTLRRRRENCKNPFTLNQLHHIQQMISLVDTSLSNMEHILEHSTTISEDESLYCTNLENEIDNFRTDLKMRNLQDVDAGRYSYHLGVFYTDFISECERLANCVINVIQTKE